MKESARMLKNVLNYCFQCEFLLAKKILTKEIIYVKHATIKKKINY